jgi:transposase-like protein
MVLISMLCPHCQSDQVIKGGTTKAGKQRYRCQNADCGPDSFVRNPAYNGHLPKVKEPIIAMSLNGSGIRDTARVLPVSPTTVMNELKKKSQHSAT